MRISELSIEERGALEAHLISTYRYDAATGKLMNRKWNREYPGMIVRITKVMSTSGSISAESGLSYGNIGWCSFSYTVAFPRRSTTLMASRSTTVLRIYAK